MVALRARKITVRDLLFAFCLCSAFIWLERSLLVEARHGVRAHRDLQRGDGFLLYFLYFVYLLYLLSLGSVSELSKLPSLRDCHSLVARYSECQPGTKKIRLRRQV